MNQKMLELVEMIKTIPTGDNAQPFRFSATENEFEVTHLHEIAEHRFNQSNVASLLSLGMIVAIIKNFASANNFDYSLRFAKNFHEEAVWLQCSFKPGHLSEAREDHELLQYLKARRTDRGPYKSIPFDFEKHNKLFQNKIVFNSKLSNDCYRLIHRFETMMFDDFPIFRDIEAWVRYSKSEVESTKTGMSGPNMLLDPLNKLFFKLFSKNTFLNLFLRPYFKIALFIRVNLLYRLSTGFGLCVLKDTSDAGIVDMGEQILKAWLLLTKEGCVLQPISSPSIVSFLVRNRKGQFLSDYAKVVNQCEELLNKNFGSQGEIIWLFRFGKPILPPERTIRMDTEKLVYQASEKPLKMVP